MQQLIFVPIKLDTIRQNPQVANTLVEHTTQPTYLYEYEDPSFTLDGSGELHVSDLLLEFDDRSCWYAHKQTGNAVNVSLSYEKVEDALRRKPAP